MSADPLVSVVIPTYNRVAQLGRVLAALRDQSMASDQFEVVVVADGCTDGTDTYLATLDPPFQLVSVSQANSGPGAARNHGVSLARGQLVLFLDDDVIAAPNLITEHTRSHASSGDELVVIGPMLTPADHVLRPWVAWEQEMLYKQYDAMERAVFSPTFRQFFTGNASLRREAVLAAGGFNTNFRRAEDIELSYRLASQGARFVFNPDAVAYHYAERSFRSWLGTAEAYGVNDVIFGRDLGRDPELGAVRRDFSSRHRGIRLAARACAGRPTLQAITQYSLRLIAMAGARLKAPRATTDALSGVYNVAYYCAMADQLGGRAAFMELVGSSSPSRHHT
jgi:GT2 family glycosyltransferase